MTTKTEKKAADKTGTLGNVAATGAVIGENVHFQKTLIQTLDEGVADILDQAQRYKNNPPASLTGYVTEADHCATFNARSALSRSSSRAIREPNGTHGDYKIVNGKKILVEGEVKYYSTAEQTENAMRGYGDRQLVGPSDQADEIRKIAARKAAKNGVSDNPARQQVASEHGQVAKNASDCITDGKTCSTPRSSSDARKLANEAAQGKTNHISILPSLGESMRLAALSGAKTGGLAGSTMGGICSGFSNTKAWLDGEKDGLEAFCDTSIDVAKSAADGAVKGAVGSMATAAATRVAAQTGSGFAKTVFRSSGPAVVAISTIEVGKHAFDFARGEIDGEEFVEKSAKTAATGGAGWAGAELGMMAGAAIAGPVGALIGGLLGGIGGALGVGALFS